MFLACDIYHANSVMFRFKTVFSIGAKKMKKLCFTLLLVTFAGSALACDEECLRDRAMAKTTIEFPSYLTWKFCEDTKKSFIDADVRSLESYRDNRLDASHKTRMKNIRSFVQQRKEWLMECDQYLDLTEHGRIFKDEETTKSIFAAMDKISSELDSLIAGVTYVSAEGGADTEVVAGRFDDLFKLVDNHKTVMMLQRQFVSQDSN